jgi:hypothetical protein
MGTMTTTEKLKLAYQRKRARDDAAMILCGIVKPVPRMMERMLYDSVGSRTGDMLHINGAFSRELGLRPVSYVKPEPRFIYGSDEWSWKVRKDRCGWFTNNNGESWKDGDGLVWGIVFQLPSKHGRARFVAGYEFGGHDEWMTVDLSKVYTAETNLDGSNPVDIVPPDCVLHADALAEEASEKEREYQSQFEQEVANAD